MHTLFVTLRKKSVICIMPLAQLSNPPIREAIISVSFAGFVELDLLEKFRKHEYIKEHYPDQRNALAIQLQGELKAEQNDKNSDIPLSASQQQDGFIMIAQEEEQTKVVQTKIGQLSFHLTNRYETWNAFIGEFKKLWSVFCEIVYKTNLTQISLRYVNEIEIGLPMEYGFEEYLNLLPNIPVGINNTLNRFFIQLDMPNKANTLNSIITETFVTENDKVKVLLDINVRKDDDFECNSEMMWQGFEEMRSYKNELFERCLTPKTIKMYE